MARSLSSVGLARSIDDRAPIEVSRRLWPGMLDYVAHQRITGLAVAAVRNGSLLLSEDQMEELLDRHKSAMSMVIILEHRLITVIDALAAAGVRSVVLKGAAVAHSFYPDPSWRTYGDLDLLVPAGDWRTACSVLAEAGFGRLIPEPRHGFDERFGKGASYEDDRGIQVDLHRTLALGPFGLWIEPDALFDRTAEFRIKGKSFRRLDDTAALLHACVHASLGRTSPRLVPLRDVVQIASSGQVDWGLAWDRARAWRLGAPISHAMRTAAATLAIRLPDEAARLLMVPVGPIERRALAAYTTDRASRGGSSLAMLWALRGVRARAAYLRALLFPDRPFLEARTAEGSGGSYLRRWMVPIRWAEDRIRAAHRSRR